MECSCFASVVSSVNPYLRQTPPDTASSTEQTANVCAAGHDSASVSTIDKLRKNRHELLTTPFPELSSSESLYHEPPVPYL